VDPLKIIGVVLLALLIAFAGSSFGMPGLVIGLLIGISLAFCLVRLLRTRANKGRAFDPVPTWSTTDDRRQQADRRRRA
jgi:hypothetical protein